MKSRKIVILFVFFFIAEALFPESTYLGRKFLLIDEYGFVTVDNDTLTFEESIENGQFISLPKYDTFSTANRNYILLHYLNQNVEFLTLVKKIPTLSDYKSWEIPYSSNITGVYLSSKLVGFTVDKADSFIVETDKNGNEISFLPDSLFNVVSNPWAVSQNCESPKIYLKDSRYCVPGFSYADIEELVFINGFVNPEKQYLYEQNSRAKTIRIQYDDVDFVTTLKDTGNYQSVRLPEAIKRNSGKTISIEIIDSYEGTKYTDIVISGILFIEAVLN